VNAGVEKAAGDNPPMLDPFGGYKKELAAGDL
jgi:hypothetical protein